MKALCTIDLKKDEQCFLEITKKYDWEFVTYTPDELNEIEFPSPSETVFKYTGAYGVSEPAPMRYAQVPSLLLEKKNRVMLRFQLLDTYFKEEVHANKSLCTSWYG